MRWRQGDRVPFTVYEQLAMIPRHEAYPDGDRPLAMFRTEADAKIAADSVTLVQRLGDMWWAMNLGGFPDSIEKFREAFPGMATALDETVTMQTSITCPTCGRTSYNPNDIANAYCGACGYHDGSLRK